MLLTRDVLRCFAIIIIIVPTTRRRQLLIPQGGSALYSCMMVPSRNDDLDLPSRHKHPPLLLKIRIRLNEEVVLKVDPVVMVLDRDVMTALLSRGR